MNRLRVLIVDDEPLARKRVADLLKDDPEIRIVGECPDGIRAVAEIRRHRPQLVFLDVQMPEMDGFDVIATVGTDRMPPVIFVTAYDQYALKAFDVHAIDYLLKPFERKRFRTALKRAKHAIASGSWKENENLSPLLAQLREDGRAEERIIVRESGRVTIIKPDEIDWIEAAGNYVTLHVGGKKHLHRETLKSLERRLAPSRFIRCHRSAIVNIDRVRELRPRSRGDSAVVLRDDSRLPLSRRFRKQLEKALPES